jgi:hypothetical protein
VAKESLRTRRLNRDADFEVTCPPELTDKCARTPGGIRGAYVVTTETGTKVPVDPYLGGSEGADETVLRG